jgi:hypothetical protein
MHEIPVTWHQHGGVLVRLTVTSPRDPSAWTAADAREFTTTVQRILTTAGIYAVRLRETAGVDGPVAVVGGAGVVSGGDV